LYKNIGANRHQKKLQAILKTLVRDKAIAFKMFELASKREISSQLEKDIFNNIAEYNKKISCQY